MTPDARESGSAFAKSGALLYRCVLPAWFLLVASYFAATAANVLAHFALRQPTFDQFKEYAHYLSQPFLTSVFMLENGHRPVFPALIANIEILAMHANQMLQLGVGSLCIALVVATVAFVAWRHAMPRAARAAAVMLAVLGVLWLANARMLVQGMGQLQVYLVVVSVIAAALATWRAHRSDSPGAMLLASTACLMAMFTFGAGAAAFPTIIALGVWLRLRVRLLIIPALAWMAGLLLYLVVLPGHEGVQHSLSFRPLDSAWITAQWLSSPWPNALLGLADPPVQPWLRDTLTGAMTRAADTIVATSHLRWPTLSALIGVLGIVVFVVRTAWRYLRRSEPSRYETLATALGLFGLLTAVVIGIGRLDAFDAMPAQVFADRYLAWPCLFWMGLALLLLDDACRSGRRAAIAFILVACFILPLVLWQTHRAWAGWSAAVYRATERAAAAARSDVLDPDVLPNSADATRDDVLQSLAAFKARHLAMFADTGWELMQTQATPAAPRDGVLVDARIVSSFDDPISTLASARVEGVVRDGVERIADCQLAVVDDDDRVVGIAQYSFMADGAGIMRLRQGAKRGFDAYIRGYRADRHYRIAAVQVSTHQLVAQSAIAPAH